MRRPCGSFSTSQSRLVSAIASAETSHIATLQPSATSCRASSRPMPVPPPVMTAIFPAKSFMGGSLTFPVLIARLLVGASPTEDFGHSMLEQAYQVLFPWESTNDFPIFIFLG